MLYTLIENPSSHFDSVEYIPVVQRSIYKGNDPDQKDFLSQNPDLIWGILIGLMLIGLVWYVFFRKKRR
ncbi:LPXTG cell wall anchor domain-containing protein [Roseivirga echinicomitans]